MSGQQGGCEGSPGGPALQAPGSGSFLGEQALIARALGPCSVTSTEPQPSSGETWEEPTPSPAGGILLLRLGWRLLGLPLSSGVETARSSPEDPTGSSSSSQG